MSASLHTLKFEQEFETIWNGQMKYPIIRSDIQTLLFVILMCITFKVSFSERWEASKSFIHVKGEQSLNSAQLENRIYVTIMIILAAENPYISNLSIHINALECSFIYMLN